MFLQFKENISRYFEYVKNNHLYFENQNCNKPSLIKKIAMMTVLSEEKILPLPAKLNINNNFINNLK